MCVASLIGGISRLNHAHPLDGLAQVSVSGWPASAWMPDDGLLTTLLSLPCAATRAAKARTRETQGRMVIGCLKLILGIELYASGRVRQLYSRIEFDAKVNTEMVDDDKNE